MALRATIYKADLRIADMDRHYYCDHGLTLARHPSETEERLMVRLVAFALKASERLEFGAGLSDSDEPDLCLNDDTGQVQLWIDVGLPDEKRIRKACNKAGEVLILAYGGSKADQWWNQTQRDVQRFNNLTVLMLHKEHTDALTKLCSRGMRLDCSMQEGRMLWISEAGDSADVEPQRWFGAERSA